MKKLLSVLVLSLALVMIFGTCAFANNTIKFGFDLGGTHTQSVAGFSIDDDVNPGISLGYEYTMKPNNHLEYGAGIEYQPDRSIKDYDSVKFSFVPIYLTFRTLNKQKI